MSGSIVGDGKEFQTSHLFLSLPFPGPRMLSDISPLCALILLPCLFLHSSRARPSAAQLGEKNQLSLSSWSGSILRVALRFAQFFFLCVSYLAAAHVWYFMSLAANFLYLASYLIVIRED